MFRMMHRMMTIESTAWRLTTAESSDFVPLVVSVTDWYTFATVPAGATNWRMNWIGDCRPSGTGPGRCRDHACPAVHIDERTGTQREIELVYPDEADPARGRISVLTPVGSALLGLRVGQEIPWDFPDGAVHRLKVAAVTQKTP